ncbi:amidoligase family protein [Paenibacillus solisilvae]|uniref:Amidoligase family protein n=1 Tax=Paenibacillus solisilvae TaxID=2486751 RepID=A0ABW0W2Z7_9BACL
MTTIMWPREVNWKDLRFGVEIEFVGGQPEQLELLPGWVMALDEHQVDSAGAQSGSELKPPPILWRDRKQLQVMLDRLSEQGAEANWSCGLHVHVGLEPWGQDIILPLLDAALCCQDALRSLLQTSEHRLLFCPPVTPEMRSRYMEQPCADAVHNSGRPQSHRCGINTAAWFDIGTVEIRYANGSLNYDEVLRTAELCLRFVAAVGAGRQLSPDPELLAAQLGAPAGGYPFPASPPQWFKERTWLEEALFPLLAPIAASCVPNGEILHIIPTAEGLLVGIEDTSDGSMSEHKLQLPLTGWGFTAG